MQLSVLMRSVILTLILAISASPMADNVAAADSPRLLVLGDSLSAAYGINTDEGWVSLLQGWLKSAVTEEGQKISAYTVINASISGETTGGALARLPSLLDKHQPAIVIIELGGNDGLRGYPISRIRDNLTQLIRLCRQAGARVLLTAMHIPPNYGQRYANQFYASYALSAQQWDVLVVPFLLQDVATNPDLMQADGIHPTAEAQPMILNNVLPVLKQLL